MKTLCTIGKKTGWILILAICFCVGTALFCGALANTLTLPSGLKTIEEEAFYGDTSLDEVVLPEGLESIGSKAFAGSSLRKINLPASLSSIADDAFAGCSLTRVSAEADTAAYQYALKHRMLAPATPGGGSFPDPLLNVHDGRVFESNHTVTYNETYGDLVIVPDEIFVRLLLQSYIFTKDVKVAYFAYALNEAPDYADANQVNRRVGDFLWNMEDEGIVAVRYFEQGAEDGCLSRITAEQMHRAPYVKVHLGVAEAGEDTPSSWYCFGIHFVGSDDYTFADYGNGTCKVTGYTGSETFLLIPARNAEGLPVTGIGNNAFSGRSDLTGSLTIPDSVTLIGSQAFYGCSGLSGPLTLPARLKKIEYRAFMNCSGFTGSLTIPSSVKTIGKQAFYGCSGFTGSLSIPEGVTGIGSKAFTGSSINVFNLPASLTTIADDAFPAPDKATITAEAGTYAYTWAVRNGYIDACVTDIELDVANYRFTFGQPHQVTATVLPAEAANPQLRWVMDSGDEGLSIDENTGVITATQGGRIKIHAEATDGSGVVSESMWVYSVPSAVPALNVTRVGGYHVILNWNSVPGAQRYHIEYNDGTGWILLSAVNADQGTAYTFRGKKTTTYRFRIFANGCTKYSYVNELGCTDYSAEVTATTIEADAPYASLVSRTDTTATISMTAGANTDYYRIIYYTVEKDEDGFPVFEEEIEDIEAALTEYTITGLEPGTRYAIDVYATPWDGGPYTLNSRGSILVTTALPVPAAPNQKALTTPAIKRVKVSWDAVDGADGYLVYYNTVNDITAATEISGIAGTATSYTITGLKEGTVYYTWVKAVNAYGTSAASNVKSRITFPAAPTVNNPVVNGNSITVTWSAAAGATYYVVHYGTENNYSQSSVSPHVTGLSYELTNLERNTTYYLWVTSFNSSGGAHYPAAKVAKTDTIKVTGITLDENASRFTFGQPHQIAATITPADATNKQLLWVRDSGDDGLSIDPGTGVITATQGGRIKVHAEATDGSGVVSDSMWVYSIPSAVPSLTVSRVGGKTIELAWNSVPGAQAYKIYYREAGSGEWDYERVSAETLSYTFIGRTKKTYEFMILAKGRYVGDNANTETSPVLTVSMAVADEPYATLVSSATTNTSAKISMQACQDMDYFYIYYCTADKDEDDFPLMEDEIEFIDKSLTSYTITGLEPGTKYYIEVYATLWDGAGKTINSYRDGTIVVTTSGNGPNTRPAKPKNVEATAASANSIRVTWDPAGSGNGYWVRWKNAEVYNAATSEIQLSGRSTSEYTITGLNANTKYNIYVSSYLTSNGNESYKAIVSATTNAADVGQVTGVTQTAYTSNSISLSWTGVSSATRYEVWWRDVTASAGAWSYKEVSGSTSTKITGLSANKTYEVCVVALCGSTRGPQSASVNMSTTTSTVAVTGVSLNVTETALTLSETLILTETVSPSNASNKAVTWTSSKTSVATVSSSGVVTPHAAGTATITVKTVDGNMTATCTVTVVPDYVPVTGVTLNQTTMSLGNGGTGTLTATVAPGNATNKGVNWTSSNTDVATVSNGTVTARAAGTATITATTADGGKTATCTVTVTPTEDTFIVKKGDETIIAQGQTSGTFACGQSAYTGDIATFTVTSNHVWSVTPSDTGWMNVEKTSATTAVVTIGAVSSGNSYSSDLVFTANGKTYTVTVTLVKPAVPVTGVSVSPQTLTLTVGGSAPLTETVSPSDATNKAVTWGSSDEAVATVDGSGVVTAHAAGTTTITVTTVDGGKPAYCTVTVQPASVAATGVQLDQHSLTLTVGGSNGLLTATVLPENATNKVVTWHSDDEAVATVNSNGVVKPVGAGTTEIYVTTSDGNHTASCQITVSVGEHEHNFVDGVCTICGYDPVIKRGYIFIAYDLWNHRNDSENDKQLYVCALNGSNQILDIYYDMGCATGGDNNVTSSELNSSLSHIASVANENDITYIYLVSHGSIDAWMWINDRYSSDNHYYFSDLATRIYSINGTVILFLNPCHSGLYIREVDSTVRADKIVFTGAWADEVATGSGVLSDITTWVTKLTDALYQVYFNREKPLNTSEVYQRLCYYSLKPNMEEHFDCWGDPDTIIFE